MNIMATSYTHKEHVPDYSNIQKQSFIIQSYFLKHYYILEIYFLNLQF